MGRSIANLWRVLALSWLGGIASPSLSGDVFPGEIMRPFPALARLAEAENWSEVAEIYSREAEAAPAQTHSGAFDDQQI